MISEIGLINWAIFIALRALLLPFSRLLSVQCKRCYQIEHCEHRPREKMCNFTNITSTRYRRISCNYSKFVDMNGLYHVAYRFAAAVAATAATVPIYVLMCLAQHSDTSTSAKPSRPMKSFDICKRNSRQICSASNKRIICMCTSTLMRASCHQDNVDCERR